MMLAEDAPTMTRETDDDALAHAAQQHPQDPTAFAELYRRYLPGVYRYCLVRLGHVQQAEDVTAETFLAALEHIGSYRGPGRFSAWLLGIARHKVINHMQSQRTSVSLAEADQVPSPNPSLEQVVAARLQLEQVARTLHALAPDRAEALALRIFGGLGVAEVGDVMGKSEAAVKMLVHRAVSDLHERLAFRSEP
jgi:RNA polymerase sigma-70 factor (ECF subfamily)